MVMYTLVCYNNSTCVIYSCLNVFTDRTSSRGASVVIPENSFNLQIKTERRGFTWIGSELEGKTHMKE